MASSVKRAGKAKFENGIMCLGTYLWEGRQFNLFVGIPGANKTYSGYVDFPCVDKPVGEIYISLHEDWVETLGTVLHEVIEGSLCNRGVCLTEYGAASETTSSRYFFLSHQQFDETVTRAADLLSVIVPRVSNVWEAWRKEKG